MTGTESGEAEAMANRWFATTHWSVVLAAAGTSSPGSDGALERLCRTYWYPLYAFIRRKGDGAHEAEDLTQGFFARFLARRDLEDVAREKGRFRTFLLCAVDHYLANEWDKTRRLKRGGGLAFLPLETAQAEERYGQAPADAGTPERVFDRRWAETMLEVVLARLRAEYADAGKDSRFEVLKAFLLGEPEAEGYGAVAARLGMTAPGVKSAVHRMRGRFRDLFREEIAHTVATRAEIDEELRYLVRLMTH
jgi:DNA-directed RNA polymerase specialized sigma24 family protein